MDKPHRYEYSVDMEADNAATRVVRMVGHGKRVLEIGAGPGSITRILSGYADSRVTALELDKTAIEKLTPFCERVYQSDLNNPDWSKELANEPSFQVVVAADVLEHLYEPLQTLRAMAQLLDNDGYLVVSLPHIAHNSVLACLVAGDFCYQEWGLLDRTHIRFFGIENMQKLFDDAELNVVDAEFVLLAPERTEFSDCWRKASPELKRALQGNRFGSVYQVVIKAEPKSGSDGGLNLLDLAVPSSNVSFPRYSLLANAALFGKGLLKRRLSFERRRRIRQMLDRLRRTV
jgi:2-polyprenyl-3-methyl-5-hydroxy-6-metoxy-1,4-benzoquinol methylase